MSIKFATIKPEILDRQHRSIADRFEDGHKLSDVKAQISWAASNNSIWPMAFDVPELMVNGEWIELEFSRTDFDWELI